MLLVYSIRSSPPQRPKPGLVLRTRFLAAEVMVAMTGVARTNCKRTERMPFALWHDRHGHRAVVRGAALIAALIIAPVVRAQRCTPEADSHEADLFAIRSLSLAMSRGTAIGIESAGTIRVGAEGVFLPTIDKTTATPTTCRPGKDAENVNSLKFAGRARVSVSLPKQLTLEASWLPPVELKGMKANLFGVALGGARQLTDRWVAALRAHATFGSVKGPFTCPQESVDSSTGDCAGGTLSNDEFKPNIVGGDFSLGFNAPTSRFAWFGGAGYSRLMPRFQVHFRDATGFLDTTRVEVDLNRIALFAGVSSGLGHRARGSAEFYGTTSDGVTGRITIDVAVHGGRREVMNVPGQQ